MKFPIHKHDCDRCYFLGVFNNQDLYFCPSERVAGWTLISRYGIQGDYCSGGWKTENPQMLEARRRAVACGFIKEDEYT
ncbi:hypothetical protein D3C75_659790 [compost metagenome]